MSSTPDRTANTSKSKCIPMHLLVGQDASPIKQSLSMTSLPPPGGAEGNFEMARLREDRPYNSLKKRRDTHQWRRSWESGQSLSSLYNYSGLTSKDDFWAAIQNNYDYIMDTNLIDSCKEARGELETIVPVIDDTCELLTPTPPEWTEPPGNVCEDSNRLRRWLRDVEARLAAHTFSAAAQWPRDEIERRLAEHADLQREICAQGRSVGALVRACGSEEPPLSDQASSRTSTAPKGARGLERRYHLLYLKALEWQCHLEGLLGTRNTPSPAPTRSLSDTDEEPAPKLARLSTDSTSANAVPTTAGHIPRSPLKECSTLHYLHLQNSGNSSYDSGSELVSDFSESSSFSDDDDCPLKNVLPLMVPPALQGGSEGDVESLEGDAVLVPIVVAFEDTMDQRVPEGCPVQGQNGHHDMDTEPDFTENTNPILTKITDTVIKRVKSIEITKFNRPNRPKATNFATFYFRHLDTDSDIDRQMAMESENGIKPFDVIPTSDSENDDTNVINLVQYNLKDDVLTVREVVNHAHGKISPAPFAAKNDNKMAEECEISPILPNIQRTVRSNKENIQKLVRDVEHMVREDADKGRIGKQGRSRSYEPLSIVEGNHQNKMSRIKEWLRKSTIPLPSVPALEAPADSGDASGECTTSSESDSGASQDSDSNAHSGSIATFRRATAGTGSQCTSTEIIDTDAAGDTPDNSPAKVIRRLNKNTSARPWSVSCLSQLALGAPLGQLDCTGLSKQTRGSLASAHFSISESALHVLGAGRIGQQRCDSKGELRRKKLKNRKRQGRKSESGSDNANLGLHSTPNTLTVLSQSNNRTLIKSSSFSGHPQMVSSKIPEHEPTNIVKSPVTPTTEQLEIKPVNFKIGGNISNPPIAVLEPIINSEHSSMSESWDNYQDKYLSESYSECVDTEAARKLLDFGEDYRNFLDSQSDCCSSLSNFAPNVDKDIGLSQNMNSNSADYISKSMDAYKKLNTEMLNKDYEARKRKVDKTKLRTLSVSSNDYKTEKINSDCIEVEMRKRKSELNQRRRSSVKDGFIYERRNSQLRDSDSSKDSMQKRKNSNNKNNFNINVQDYESPKRRNSTKMKCKNRSVVMDSDSESDEVRRLIHESKIQLERSELLWGKNKTTPQQGDHFMLQPRDYAEIIITCRENIRCLESVMARACSDLLNAPLQRDLKELLSRWDALRGTAEALMEARELHGALLGLKAGLRVLGNPLTLPENEEQLQRAIEELQKQQLELEDYKSTMLRLNVSAHSLITTYNSLITHTVEVTTTQTTFLESNGSVTTTTTSMQKSDLANGNTTRDRLCNSSSLFDEVDHSDRTRDQRSSSSILDHANRLKVVTVRVNTDDGDDEDGLLRTTDVGVNSVGIGCSLDGVKEGGLNSLKDEVSEVYREWDDADQRIATRLAQLSGALAAWRQWESGLGALQRALRGDERALEGLRDGHGGSRLADSVRDMARILSEKIEVSAATSSPLDITPSALPLDGGSLSDSGISDGGSDWGLSERERRLGALRRLHRQLEQALAPGSKALQAITKRMEQAESDLRALQLACKELLARTAVQEASVSLVAARGSMNAVRKSTSRSPNSKRKNKRRSPAKSSPDSDDPPPGDSGSGVRGWGWKRVAKVALPLQMALVALFCAACLLEPHCCDTLNNWTLTLAPQLRYVRGPPPV